ncbi:LysR family transcriptional regulator [Streptomyces mirabilis]|uniref:LysR family transcriptional regulator n=1 Tax=Streptomyces mirabilis TaxID=68239 RepID=UPI0036A41350
MNVELRQLRCLVAIVDEGTFTDAAIALGVSQAAVSRTLASLECVLGVRLLRRTSREVAPTATGLRVLAHARRVLGEVADLVQEATSGRASLRLVRVNSTTAGLAEGACDAAVVRRPLDDRRFDSAIVGLERRLCALAADDPLAGRRSVRLADLGGRVLLIDRRTGTTTTELFPPDSRPVTRETHDVDEWLTEISTGRCVGMTAESTAHQYPRPGVVYRPVRDAEPIAVRLAWWRDAPHPAAPAAIELLTELYRRAT